MAGACCRLRVGRSIQLAKIVFLKFSFSPRFFFFFFFPFLSSGTGPVLCSVLVEGNIRCYYEGVLIIKACFCNVKVVTLPNSIL